MMDLSSESPGTRRTPKGVLKANTQGGRLLRVLVLHWPGYAGGPHEFGNDFYTGRNRMGDTLKPRGFRTVNRQREGHSWYEWRFETEEIYREAALLVRSWDTGEDLEVLRAREAIRSRDSGCVQLLLEQGELQLAGCSASTQDGR